jgi:hypothetical protein
VIIFIPSIVPSVRFYAIIGIELEEGEQPGRLVVYYGDDIAGELSVVL